ncbi:MAG: bifunctional oligoribonuclease/PAP phosphatase NrnA [Fibrobacter sp.]|nr:bifunctional oligoribonuclease/PAP phosphatase NrnA [Fibrobacter sp.]
MSIDQLISQAKSIAIFGHVRPDGDCVGSTLAMYNYIRSNYPGVQSTVFLEPFPDSYKLLNGAGDVSSVYDGRDVDLAILMDASTWDRVGANGAECFKKAKVTLNIDHHVSNNLDLCAVNIVEPDASSASEVLFYQMDRCKINKATANCLYLGIVHDTGAFKFSCTSKRTMNAVGELIDKGADFSRIVNDTYYTRTYKQTLVTGYVMQHCKMALDNKLVYSYITPDDLSCFNAEPRELSNIIDTIREVGGTEVAVFLYPVNGKYKISLRSNYVVDVNAIAKEFGGGGHVRAAGGDTEMAPEKAIQKIIELVAKQI